MVDSSIVEFEKLCNTVLEVNDNIQSVSVINKNGRAVERKIQDGIDLPISDQKSEMLLMQCVLTISMGRDFDEDFGEIGYVHIDRKNLSMFSFPLSDYILLVTSKATIGPISLATKITLAIRKYRKPEYVGKHSVVNSNTRDSQRQPIVLSQF